jgi:hypothetical protein
VKIVNIVRAAIVVNGRTANVCAKSRTQTMDLSFKVRRQSFLSSDV